MFTSEPSLTLAEAHQLLKQFGCLEQGLVESVPKAALREALLLLARHSDYQILGICANTATQACLALKTYAEVLGYTPNLNFASTEGAVYTKYNPQSGLSYMEPYTGTSRGVLVSCQSAYESGVSDLYGPLPLDLW